MVRGGLTLFAIFLGGAEAFTSRATVCSAPTSRVVGGGEHTRRPRIATSSPSTTRVLYKSEASPGSLVDVERSPASAPRPQVAEDKYIDDANYESILSKSGCQLVDATSPRCGPCRLIESNLRAVLPEHEGVAFYKWNVDERDRSQEFMNVLRRHDMTFNALPTLILFRDGRPVALRSGMATPLQIDQFLKENV